MAVKPDNIAQLGLVQIGPDVGAAFSQLRAVCPHIDAKFFIDAADESRAISTRICPVNFRAARNIRHLAAIFHRLVDNRLPAHSRFRWLRRSCRAETRHQHEHDQKHAHTLFSPFFHLFFPLCYRNPFFILCYNYTTHHFPCHAQSTCTDGHFANFVHKKTARRSVRCAVPL